MKTTLNKIKCNNPCRKSWRKLLESLGKTESDYTEVSIEYILGLLGLDDALWALRAVDGYNREIRLLACDYAEHVLHIFEEAYPDDKRPRQAIDVARRYSNGNASQEELDAASEAGCAARWAARDVAMWAASAARWAARGGSWEAVGYAAWWAARDGSWEAVSYAAWAAARAAGYSERQWQEQKLRELLK